MERSWYHARMGKSEQTQHLLQSTLKLRRVQERIGNDPDLAEVRAGLENELGGTVSLRAAARFLGVSHTTLNRWARRGDLSLVPSPEGPMEISVSSLLDLHERLEESRRVDPDTRHMESLMREDREKAGRMRPYRYTSSKRDRPGHRRAENFGLVYHRAIAGRLKRSMVEEAKYRVHRWEAEGKLHPKYAGMWKGVLDLPIAEIKKAITDPSQRGKDLRQNSPFAGELNSRERARLLKAAR